MTYQLTQGVTKNIIPAIASTNAIVAASCVLEALKIATMCAQGLNNYAMYNGGTGVYTHCVSYERDAGCPVCSAGVLLELGAETTLQGAIDAMLGHPTLGAVLAAPSVSHGSTNLYVRGALEAHTAPNLGRRLAELLEGAGERPVLTVNDKKLPAPLRVRLRWAERMES